MTIKCKQCIYFSGVHTVGHGECYGSCNLLGQLMKYIECYNEVLYVKYSDKVKNTYLYDDSNCILIENDILKIVEREKEYVN